MTIPPQLLESLSDEVARVFTQDDLVGLLPTATGSGLFEVWAPPGKPLRATVFAMLGEVSRQGFELVVLHEMLRRRPAATALADIVRQACPKALEALPALARSVEQLVSGLTGARALLADPEVRALLVEADKPLRDTLISVDRLDVYKSLHEFLHLLQAKQYRALRDAARRLPDSPEAATELVSYRNQLRQVCALARDEIRRLPGAVADQTVERLWVDLLEEEGDRFHTAVRARQRAAAQSALRGIRDVMLTTPRRLDGQIFATAQDLPLDRIAALLDKLTGRTAPAAAPVPTAAGAPVAAGGAPVTAGGDPVALAEPDRGAIFAEARGALALIIPRLRAGVSGHKDWQDVDNRVVRVEQLFEGDRTDLIEDFTEEWIGLKALVLGLLARDPGSAAGKLIEDCIRDVGDAQTGMINVDDSADAAKRQEADAAFDLAFLLFRSEVQQQFLEIDGALKRDCSELVRIGGPLRDIIEDIGQ